MKTKLGDFLTSRIVVAYPPFVKKRVRVADGRNFLSAQKLVRSKVQGIVACLLAVCLSGVTRAEESAQDWVKSQLDALVMLYRDLHAHPELSQQEQNTAQRIAEELRRAGFETTEKVGGFGVVGLLRNGDGPTVMLRCDLDALPVTEQTGLAFSSRVTVKDATGADVGVMHACGHDVHMTNFIGTARYLASHKDRWKGTAMFVGQPAEERGAGARAMLTDGLFTRFRKPDAAIALHVDAFSATGTIGIRKGYALANTDSVDITVRGKGGHGAYPHKTIDPIVQAAELVLSLQTLVSREVKPTEPAVVTVGSIHGGSKHNIIGPSCQLQLTVRSYSDEVRSQLVAGIRRKAMAIAQAYNAPEPEIQVTEGTPALHNDEKLATQLGTVLKHVLGPDKVIDAEPSMGGEDFSEYGRAGVPILMFWLGSVNAKRLERFKELGQEPPSLHSPLFYPDIEETLSTGVPALAEAAIELFRPAAATKKNGD